MSNAGAMIRLGKEKDKNLIQDSSETISKLHCNSSLQIKHILYVCFLVMFIKDIDFLHWLLLNAVWFVCVTNEINKSRCMC